MRSDENLSSSSRRSKQWINDPLSNRKNAEVVRFSLPDQERIRMSLSGKERNHLFLNQAGETFADISGISGADSVCDGRAFAVCDFDRDGWQDILLVNTNSPLVQLFRNRLGSQKKDAGNFVALRFVGGNTTGSRSDEFGNRNGYGARYRIQVADKTLSGHHTCGEGFASQNSQTKLVGIGSNESVKSIEINWPSGKKQTATNIRSGELVTFFEDPSTSEDGKSFSTRSRYLLKNPITFPNRIAKDSDERTKFRNDANQNSKLVIYVSMASWCEACRTHMPLLKQLSMQFEDRDIQLIGVPIDPKDDADKLNKFAEQTNAVYELNADWKSQDREAFQSIVKQRLNSEPMPAAVITNAKGDVLKVMAGVPTISDVARQLVE